MRPASLLAASIAGATSDRASGRAAVTLVVWLVAMLWVPGLAAANGVLPSLRLDVSTHCGGIGHSAPARIVGDTLQLNLPPGSRWAGWSRESGIDLVFEINAAPDQAAVRLDSSPARHALDPWWLSVGADGTASIGLRALGRSQARSLSLKLVCVDDLDANAQARWRASHALASELSQWFERGGLDRAWRWLSSSFHLLWLIDGDPETQIWLDFQLAAAARRAGFLEQAKGWFELAAERAVSIDDPELEILALLWTGKAALGLGDPDVEVRFESVRQRAAEAGLDYVSSVAGQDLCIAKRLAGKLAEAADCYRHAIAVSRRLEEWSDLAIAQSNLANALVTQGDLQGARQALDDALETATLHDSPRVRWNATRLLAQVQTWEGQYVDALETLNSALRSLDSNRPVERAHLLATLGGTYALMGEHARALDTYDSIITDMETLGQAVRAQIVSLYAAEVELRLDQPERAAQRLQTWLDGEPSASATAAVRIGRLIRAYALAEMGQHTAALEEYRHIGVGSEQWDWPRRMRALGLELELELVSGVAARQALEAAGRQAREQEHDLAHLEAVALALEHDPDLPSADALPWFDPQTARRVRSTAALLRSPELRSGLIARLRPLADRMAHSLPTGRAAPEAVHRALTDIEELRAIEQLRPSGTPGPELAMLERSVLLGALGSEQTGEAQSRDVAALNWYASFHRRIDAQQPGAAPSDWSLPALAEGELLVYPVMGRQRTSLFFADHRGWSVIADLDSKPIRRRTEALGSLLESGLADRQDVARAAAELADALQWPPRDRGDDVRRLFVVADQALGGVPWELLPGPAGGDAVLGDHTELVVLQSLRTAPQLPRFSRILTAGGNAGGGGSLAALREADAELDEVAAAWTPAIGHARLGNSAEALGRALEVPDALVHVAGHGLVGRGWAEHQGIWLGDENQPEFFSALRLAQTPARNALVVLNACETGRVVTPSRIGLAGAAGGIANSGAGMVVATRWAVSDRTARRFAKFFHEALRETPAQPARAVHAAQLRLRQMPAHRHPAEWAAWFVLAPGKQRAEPGVPNSAP